MAAWIYIVGVIILVMSFNLYRNRKRIRDLMPSLINNVKFNHEIYKEEVRKRKEEKKK